ncbi:MAG: hypothetical protein JRH20_30715, partial [Deltaproteobacteria bacterium]|nr:hypothetical protein [Deltaproteobacteria bacterium]
MAPWFLMASSSSALGTVLTLALALLLSGCTRQGFSSSAPSRDGVGSTGDGVTITLDLTLDGSHHVDGSVDTLDASPSVDTTLDASTS